MLKENTYINDYSQNGSQQIKPSFGSLSEKTVTV